MKEKTDEGNDSDNQKGGQNSVREMLLSVISKVDRLFQVTFYIIELCLFKCTDLRERSLRDNPNS